MKSITTSGDDVLLIMTKDEAVNVGERISCSSFKTFDEQRKELKLHDLPRHPLAENLQEALAEAGVTLGKEDC